MEGKGKERALPVDATDAADDEASERATQLHGQDALWLSGAARQHAKHVQTLMHTKSLQGEPAVRSARPTQWRRRSDWRSERRTSGKGSPKRRRHRLQRQPAMRTGSGGH